MTHVAEEMFGSMSGASRSWWMRMGRRVRDLEDMMTRHGSGFGDRVQAGSESGCPGNAAMADALTRLIAEGHADMATIARAIEEHQRAERALREVFRSVTGKQPPAPRAPRGPYERRSA